MTSEERLKENQQSIFELTGTYGKTLTQFSTDKKPYFAHCFKPFASKSDAFFKAATVFTSPVAFTVLGLSTAASCVNFVMGGIYEACRGNNDAAIENCKEFISHFLLTAMFAFSAVISPLLNLIDLALSCVNSAREHFATGAASPV